MEHSTKSRNRPTYIQIINFYKYTKEIKCRNGGLSKEFLDKTPEALYITDKNQKFGHYQNKKLFCES